MNMKIMTITFELKSIYDFSLYYEDLENKLKHQFVVLTYINEYFFILLIYIQFFQINYHFIQLIIHRFIICNM